MAGSLVSFGMLFSSFLQSDKKSNKVLPHLTFCKLAFSDVVESKILGIVLGQSPPDPLSPIVLHISRKTGWASLRRLWEGTC